jgi:undecaprenyl-diphosphatase
MSTTQTPASRKLLNRIVELWREIQARVELRLLLALLLIGLGLWLFIALADEVFEGDTRTLDEAILLALRNPADPSDPLGPPWLEEMGRDYTALGGTGVVGLVTGVTCLYLALSRRWMMFWLVLLVVVGSEALNSLMKLGFQRPRPDLVPHGMVVYYASFPSGHAMVSASVYLTLGVLLARIQKYRFQAALIMGTAILVTVLVGVSRVYLGVHWPSDVLAGWIAGSIWAGVVALLIWRIRKYRRRGETPQHDANPTVPEPVAQPADETPPLEQAKVTERE